MAKNIHTADYDLSSEDRRADASAVRQDMDRAYSSAEQDADISTASGRQENVLDNLTPQQFYKMYGYWDWNLAKNNPKGNLNDRTAGNTLYNSRLADAFNNRKYWKAARIGHRTNSGFGSTAMQQGQAIQYNPIETQEARQQRANEQVDLLARQGQQALATQMQGYKFNVQQNADRIRQNLAELVSQNKVNLGKLAQESIWDRQYNGSYDNYWNNQMKRFSSELDLEMKDRVMNALASLEHPFREMYASLNGAAAPDLTTDLAYQYINTALADLEPGSKEYTAALMDAISMVAGMYGEGVGRTLLGMFTGFTGANGRTGNGNGGGAPNAKANNDFWSSPFGQGLQNWLNIKYTGGGNASD